MKYTLLFVLLQIIIITAQDCSSVYCSLGEADLSCCCCKNEGISYLHIKNLT
jgi:hypothetical protein